MFLDATEADVPPLRISMWAESIKRLNFGAKKLYSATCFVRLAESSLSKGIQNYAINSGFLTTCVLHWHV